MFEPSLLMLQRPQKNDFLKLRKGKPVTVKDTGVFLFLILEYFQTGQNIRLLVYAQLCPTLCNPMNCIAHQAPLFMEFPRQEDWSELPFPPLGDFPDPRIEPGTPTLQADSLPSKSPGYFSVSILLVELLNAARTHACVCMYLSCQYRLLSIR